mmetsp:Transcript_6708/g.13118  ORF Transcript_6708/g.13118 Transcript_6708/m.13118 type:complete len:215 (+) Transcript_6708:182-826(+)
MEAVDNVLLHQPRTHPRRELEPPRGRSVHLLERVLGGAVVDLPELHARAVRRRLLNLAQLRVRLHVIHTPHLAQPLSREHKALIPSFVVRPVAVDHHHGFVRVRHLHLQSPRLALDRGGLDDRRTHAHAEVDGERVVVRHGEKHLFDLGVSGVERGLGGDGGVWLWDALNHDLGRRRDQRHDDRRECLPWPPWQVRDEHLLLPTREREELSGVL